jgi:hypothetical protein
MKALHNLIDEPIWRGSAGGQSHALDLIEIRGIDLCRGLN